MNTRAEDDLFDKIRALTPQQVLEVRDFVEFLASQSRKRAALDRLLAVAPALAAAGVPAPTEEEVEAEVRAARRQRGEQGVSLKVAEVLVVGLP